MNHRELRYKNNLLEQHLQHFIIAGSTVAVLKYFEIIEDSQMYKTFIATAALDFITKHHKQIINFVFPDLFIM